MAQQNKYRDIDKNVYDLNQPYKINEKYTKPVGFINAVIGLSTDIEYQMTNDNTLTVSLTNVADYLENHLLTFLLVHFVNSEEENLFTSSSSFFAICVSVPNSRNYNVISISGSCSNANISNTSYWLFPEIDYDRIGYRCKTATNVSNTDLGNSYSVFAISPKEWKS